MLPCGAPHPGANSSTSEDLSFRPCRGDVIVVQPNQRGRMPNRCQPRQNQGCVGSYSGRADFVFRNGDLIVRIGFYIAEQSTGISYVPYRVLELCRRHDGVWNFLGDAVTEEDLGEKRRNSCIEMHYSGGIGVGENCPIEPNYGDFVIYYDRIKCADEEMTSTSCTMIDWWTPQLFEEDLNMVYPHNTILLRPYVRAHNFLQGRHSWLGQRVTRINTAKRGKVEEGVVVMIWPESIIQDLPPSTLRKGKAFEVLGLGRVGVSVRNWRRKGTVAWPLTDTFLEGADRPLSSFESAEEREHLRAAPWGSIEIYSYSKEPPAGWVYWGSSQHSL